MDIYGKDVSIKLETLTPKNAHYTTNFFCDNQSIDEYFREYAAYDNTTVTYLFIDIDKDKVVACVTIACSAIFQYAESETLFSTLLSAMEIKYFAVDESYKHIQYESGARLTLSDYMFRYVIEYMRELSQETIGASKIVLYSVPQAVTFYERSKFKYFDSYMFGDQGHYVKDCEPMYFDLNE